MPVHTYSIVAHDPDAMQWGVAVQSHYFGTGALVPWAEPGVGAVATQSMVEPAYGPLGLAMMRAGKTAEQALVGLVRSDPEAEVRQVAMVDREGNVAVHTGSRCIPEAGHRTGRYYSVQANLMLQDTVWGAMAEAFEGSRGDLAERMMVALEAAEAEGGDIRGKQSAALLVVQGEMLGRPWQARPFDLRVDDHPEPLPELRRLLDVARAYAYGREAREILEREGLGREERLGMAKAAFGKMQALQGSMPGNVEYLYWWANDLALAGYVDEALPHFREVFAADEAWRILVPRLVQVGRLPDDAELISRILQA
jgi:uncharacterized Ntn-hydrolase superfamily protein